MKKYFSLLSVPALNIGAVIYAEIPSFSVLEEIFKLLALAASLVFTVFRIVKLLRDLRSNNKGE